MELRQENAQPAGDSDQTGAPFLGKQRRFRGKALRWTVVSAVIVCGSALLTPKVIERWSVVSIDDSRVAAKLITVSSEVSGRVTAVPVIAGDRVEKGDLLVEIDREKSEFELQALDAEVTGIEAQQNQLRAQQTMIRHEVDRKLAAGRSQIKAAEADHKSSEAGLQHARSRFDRVSRLAANKVISEQVLEDAQAALSTAEQQVESTAASIDTANANLAVTESEREQVTVLERQIETLEAQKSVVIARREQTRVDLTRHEIRADFDGVVDSTFVDAGEYVSPGTRLLIYHDPDAIWVDANVKETDFGRVKIGAPARITVDAYPDIEFHGKIVRLGQAATSEFALLPSPNPSGNFTKITQRLPIRLSIGQRDGLLRPGMMVEIGIDVVDR